MSAVDFKRVKESYTLASFFENEMGAVGKSVMDGERYSVCPHCGASSDHSVKVSVRNEKWHCFACLKRGDVIEAAAAFHGISLSEAADQLSKEMVLNPNRSRPVQPKQVVQSKNLDAIQEVIRKLLAAQNLVSDDAAFKYLESRGIPVELTQGAIARQIILTLPGDPTLALRHLMDVCGKELLVSSGIWKKDSKTPAIIYRPLAFVSDDQKGIEFRLIGESAVAIAKAIRYGEPSPCKWAGNEHVMITEGFIDMLSAVALGSERTIFAIPGAQNWQQGDPWLSELENKQVMLALDADDAGVAGIKLFHDHLPTLGCKVKTYQIPEGLKDLNDQLRALRNL